MRIVNYVTVPWNSDLWHNIRWCQIGLLLLVASFLRMAIISHYKLESFKKYTCTQKSILYNTSSWLPCECLTCFFKNVIYLEEIFLWHFVPPQGISESIVLEMVVNEDRWHSQPPGYCFHFSILAFASGSVGQLRHSLPTAGSLFSFPTVFLNGSVGKKCLCCRSFQGQY